MEMAKGKTSVRSLMRQLAAVGLVLAWWSSNGVAVMGSRVAETANRDGEGFSVSALRHLQITGRGGNGSTVSYMASIRNLASHWCGGALVAPQWVVTAAHCVDRNSSRSLRGSYPWVHIGGGPINSIKDIDVRVGFETFIHPLWSGDVSKGYDIALMKLSEPSVKSPIMLTSKNITVSSEAVLVTMGWGTDRVNGEFSEQLIEATGLEIVPMAECKSAWKGSSDIIDSMICVKPKPTVIGQRVCEGDSGGPLVMRRPQDGGENGI